MFLLRKQSDGNVNKFAVYCPNRRNLFALPLFAVGCVWGIWVCAEPMCNSGKIVTEYPQQIIFGLSISVCCTLCAKTLFYSAQQVLYCAEDGLYIAYDRSVDRVFIPWNDEIYVYETKNFKGHVYWVFSKNPLNKNESQHLATKSSWLLRIYIDETFVVWDNASRDAQFFFRAIKTHTKIIRHF